MEPEASQFESSEMLATFLASTPLLEESWRLCAHANTASQTSFAVNLVGDLAYVAFSGVQVVDCSEESCRSLVDLESCAQGIFSRFGESLREYDEEDDDQEPVMVHGGLLQLFLSFYNTPSFQNAILEILYKAKSIVFTGHSLGGAVASLSALWLLSSTQNNVSPSSVSIFCITYGSTLLGNDSFSRAIQQEKWTGNFCHVVANHDIVPRLLFAPANPFVETLTALFEFWQMSMASPYSNQKIVLRLSESDGIELYNTVLSCIEASSREGGEDRAKTIRFWPFGSYMFCNDNGGICLDNASAIVKMLHLMLANDSCVSWVDDHLKYEDYTAKICWQYMQKKTFNDDISHAEESSNEAGIALALHSSGLASQELLYQAAKSCLATARQLGFRRNVNSAKMAKSLAKITPLRAQIEWYKAYCDNSDDQMGYFDAFKRRTASKKGTKIYKNCIRLGKFWDEVIHMLETNQLCPDFHKLPKYVNASHFYKLLVEPLEIAEYYRTGMHKTKGHYIENGRQKRFEMFDKWLRCRRVKDGETSPRSKLAGLTQDSCFWARVEEAMECILYMRTEIDSVKRSYYLDKIEKFERYANGMIERKEVSIDVLAKNSSYSLFKQEWEVLKSQIQMLPSCFSDGVIQDAHHLADFNDGKVL